MVGVEIVAQAVAESIKAERKRCADIVKAARFGEIDNDLRSLIGRIERGDPAPIEKE